MMSVMLAFLVLCYIVLSLRPQFESLLYVALLLHVSSVGYMLVDVTWTDPMLGLSFVGWLLAAIAVLISKQDKLGALVSPMLGVVSVMLTLAMLAPVPSNSPMEVQVWVGLHVALILLGYLGCLGSGLLGAVYLFVQHKLKEKSLKTVVRYPSLSVLERYHTSGVWLGVIGLFTGVTAGIVWGVNQTTLAFDMTTISSLLLLAWYGASLIGRILGRSARWSAWMSSLGLGVLTVYFFLSAVIGSWHMGGIG
jgi:ABC-type uncharacterized transport system permease subunit